MHPEHYQNQISAAIAALQAGQAALAEEILNALFQANPVDAQVLLLRGLALAMGGDVRSGINTISKAIELQPQIPTFYYHLGQLFQQVGDVNAALPQFKKAFDLDPQYLEAANQLANLLYQSGDLIGAREVYLHALRLPALPAMQAQLQMNLATLCERLGEYDRVLALATAVLDWRPDFLPALGLLLEAQLKQPDLFAAIATAQKIYALDPAPEHGLRLLSLLPPPIFSSAADLTQWRQTFANVLADLTKAPLTLTGRPLRIDNTPFYLSYMGLNDRALLMQLAGLYRQILPEHPPSGPVKSQINSGKRRIGLCSLHFFDHSVTHCFGGVIRALGQQSDFEIVLYSMEKARQDAHTEGLKAAVHRFVVLPDDLDAAALQIAQDQLDILIYPDIGIDTFTWMLAFTRLAPVQIALSGHPVTTGIPTLDYYISSQLLEGPDAQAHYSEKLVLLAQIAVDYALPELPAVMKDRTQILTEWGLSPEKHLYLCPMMPFKFHPDLDALLLAILAGDPDAELVIFDYPQAFFSQKLLPRLQASLAPRQHRLRVLPWLPQQDFLNLLAVADVALDTPHFGAGNTAYLALGLGTPLVTLPADYLRGRSSLGLYRQMGLTALVAESSEHYVELALKLCRDKDFHARMRSEILARNHLLFGRQDGIAELMDFLRYV